jgi:hypothetical protein
MRIEVKPEGGDWGTVLTGTFPEAGNIPYTVPWSGVPWPTDGSGNPVASVQVRVGYLTAGGAWDNSVAQTVARPVCDVSLTLNKLISFDNGGGLGGTVDATDWLLTADGAITDLSGYGPSVSSSTLKPGTYVLSESGPTDGSADDYTHGSWSCSGGTMTEPGTVTFGSGACGTCTITNYDTPPSLTLVKEVKNDDGGVAQAADWVLTAAGPSGFSGAGPSVSSDDGFDIGTYTLSESGPGGYSSSGWSCTGDGQQVGNQITLGLGDSATCKIVNDDLPRLRYGRITVVKEVVGEDAPAASFGFIPSWGASFFLSDGGSRTSGELAAGIYSVAEAVLSPEQVAAGWSYAGSSCSDGSPPGAIALSANETVTCTFVNRYDREGGSLTIVKETIPASAAGFTFDGGSLGGFSLSDGESKVFPDLAAGEYSVAETPVAGWLFEEVSCWGAAGAGVDYEVVGSGVTVNLAEDQDVTCLFTNRQEETVGPEGSLTIIKRTVPTGGTGFAFDAGALGVFDLDDGGSALFTELEAGAYTVEEAPTEGWDFASVECNALDWESAGASVTVNLAEGEAAVCTFTNGELPYTGWRMMSVPLLIVSLWALLAGLGMTIWPLARRTRA